MNPIILDSNLVKTVITNSNDTVLIVFNQFGSSNQSSVNILIPLIPIIAAIIGGLIALYQVRGNTISNARITWIESFRNTIAEYCMNSELTFIKIDNMAFKVKEQNNNFYTGFNKDYDEYVSYNSNALKYSLKIKLYLNLNEDKPKRIATLINKIDSDLAACFGKYDEKYENTIKSNLWEITRLSNIIIKEEWEKAKSYVIL